MNTDERREQIAQMSKSIFSYCLSRTSSYHDAQDLSQEILLASCESIENLRDEKAFYAFIWRTADNILKSWYRKKAKHSESELDEAIADNVWDELEEKLRNDEQLRLIKRELAILNSNYRKVMIEYYINRCSVKGISARFSISESMVKYLLFQSRKRIKEGIIMERNYGEYSYNPVRLQLRWGGRPKRSYRGLRMSNIQQNILMACYYDKQSEEQLSLQTGVPTAYLEDEIGNLMEHELLTEKNGFYLSNAIIYTKRLMNERLAAKGDLLQEGADYIKNCFDEILEKVRAIGFFGSDMPQNSMKWLIVSRLLKLAYAFKLEDKVQPEIPESEVGRRYFLECEEAPKGDNYDPLMCWKETDTGYIEFHEIRVNTPRFIGPALNDVCANVLTSLSVSQPQTENDKLVCTDLIDLGCAAMAGNEVKPNYPCFTAEQRERFWDVLEGYGEELYRQALERVAISEKITREHVPERFQKLLGEMTMSYMYDEMSEITRILVEDGWLIPWTCGVNPTNLIYLK